MTPLATILADAESNAVKVLFGVVFLVIWAVSALMSMLAKKKEQERRERVRREIELGRSMPPPVQQMPGPMPPPMRPPPQMPRPQQQMPRPQQQAPRPAPPRPQQQQSKKRFPAKAPTTRRAPAPAAPQEHRPVEIAAQVEHDPIVTAPPARRAIAPSAAALNTWLRPSTLRQQFILTEILQPPLAMREDRK